MINGDTLNLWEGFGVAARRPEGKSGASGCQRFLDHCRKVICSGNEEHYDYLIKREALIVQKRVRTEIAVALQTEIEGTGKGIHTRTFNGSLVFTPCRSRTRSTSSASTTPTSRS